MRRVLLACVLLLPFLVLFAAPANALGEEHISSYDVKLAVQASGDLDVVETIHYDFGVSSKHGIYRSIPTRVPTRDSAYDRVYPIDKVHVSSPDGAPSDVDRSDSHGVTTLRIGDPDHTISGAHTYVIRYRVKGSLNAFDADVELYWNAIGGDWAVPIDSAKVTLTTPGDILDHVCFAGTTGSTDGCSSGQLANDKRAVVFRQSGLQPYQAFTVAVALPKDAVRSTGPILKENWTLKKALTPTPLTGVLALLLLIAGIAGVLWLLGRIGRDRRYAGQTPGVVPAAGMPTTEEAVPVVHREPVAVAFVPPDDLRPGQIGTLLDEQANVVDVTATIVDLAVRGYLRIEEQERAHWFSSRDWTFVKLRAGDDLLPYEKELFTGLFDSGDRVELSSLKRHFSTKLALVQDKLYTDVTKNGWFRGRPDKIRGRWQGIGFFATILSTFLAFWLFKHLHWGLVAIVLVAVGLLVWRSGRRMPSRTAKGTAILMQAKGFREYIRTAEANQLRFEEGQDIFSRYLPYAIIFGEAERWVKIFGPLAAGAAAASASNVAPTWYTGPSGWSFGNFNDSLTGFTSSAMSTIAAATPSSSGGSGFGGGGFSGGGGGGGGGGSW